MITLLFDSYFDKEENDKMNLELIMLLPAIQIVEKREAPLLGSRVTESEGLAIKHEKKIKN